MVTRECVRELLDNYSAHLTRDGLKSAFKPADLESGRDMLALDPQAQVVVVQEALALLGGLPSYDDLQQFRGEPDWNERWWAVINVANGVIRLLSQLARRSLPYMSQDVRDIIHLAGLVQLNFRIPYAALLGALRTYLVDLETLDACREDLARIRARSDQLWAAVDQRKLTQLVDDLLAGGQSEPGVVLYSDEWGDQVRPLLEAMEPGEREPWQETLGVCARASGAAPSAKWLASARAARERLGIDAFTRLAADWIGAICKSANKPPTHDPRTYKLLDSGSVLDERNADLLRGLIWLCADVEDARLASVLGDAAIAGYRKITGRGPRSAKIGGACAYALKLAPRLSGAAHLERVRLNVKQPQFVKGVERALDEAARLGGISREDLEELTVPDFGLVDGGWRQELGPAIAELAVDGVDVRLRWFDANGKPRKAEPAGMKRDFKDELKALKRLRDDIAHMLAAQRDRLERLPLAERDWSLAEWRQRYLDHPLIGGLARRLIWRFTVEGRPVDGAWLDGALVDVDDYPLGLTDSTRVTTWHPVFTRAEETLAWRMWLARHQVTQPFKQAHREVYLLTDAERNTRVYSNRFAGHILKQHQFNALCSARGWRNSLRLMVDDEYPPARIDLPHWNLRAEYWVEGAGDTYEVDTNATGTYLRVATDQIRFYTIGTDTHYAHATGGGYHRGTYGRGGAIPSLPLDEIPALVFSEVMRDVDLFVGVASVGADPTWQDGGPNGRYIDYWYHYSFGDLSASAETRKQTLEWLTPRLTIADRCEVDGRFLRVRGDLRVYKIHLGSGNILMEPNDQYLCIVPSRGPADARPEGVYLPFEGDAVLSIILSKAFLLAEDTKITDVTITRQIGQ